MNNLKNTIIDEYYKNIQIDTNIHQLSKLKNVLFFNKMKKITRTTNFKEPCVIDSIISHSINYKTIKHILIDNIIATPQQKRKIRNDFKTLEKLGFNSFCCYNFLNDNIKNTISSSMPYLLLQKFPVKHINRNNNSYSILNNVYKTSLHTGIFDMLSFINQPTFMPLDVYTYYDDSINSFDVYKLKGTYINRIYLPTNTSFPYLNNIIQITNITLNALGKFFNKDLSNLQIDIIIYNSNIHKKLPQTKNTIISKNNINSADCTLFDIPIIRIFRNEELIKVLIHELIHASNTDNLFNNKNFVNSYGVSNKINLNEATTEAFAEFINCVIYAESNRVSFKNTLDKEIMFGLLQSSKIFNHFCYSTIEQYLYNPFIHQDTAAFEYHVIKTILLINFDKFLSIVKNGTIKVLSDTIDSVLYLSYYKAIINRNIDNIEQLNNYYQNTVKMSVIDILS